MSVKSVMPSNHLILFCPFLLPPSIIASIRVFPGESILHIKWPKDWSFSFSISPINEYSGLISFRIDWVDLLAAQGTLKSLLQHPQLKINLKTFLYIKLSSPGGLGQRICLPVNETQETWVWSLGWKIPRRREWLPTPGFLPGEFHGQRSLRSYIQSMWSQRIRQD